MSYAATANITLRMGIDVGIDRKTPNDRRAFLQLAAGAVGAAALPPGVARALALPANHVTGTIRDVEHVVILMQENRSFDHYFGTLRGVRGYGDPRPIDLPGGQPVWNQPAKDGASFVSPFHLDTTATRAETMRDLDHSWKESHAVWKHHDAWVPTKTALTMGYFTRADIPFYYALADAFTICDAYHCSIFGPTNPNRLFLFTGTSGLAAGDDSRIVIANPPEEKNNNAPPAEDSPEFPGLSWPTYAERLQAAGVSWKVYQEYENYGDNGLSYFKTFRGIGPDSVLFQRGRAWSPGSTKENCKDSDGDHLVAQFAADVAADRLPQVSWIVTNYKLSEHPQASPSDGEHLTARLIAALASNPKVWAKTVFILNYDENDGFFDHVPPPVPSTGTAAGKSTVDMAHEDYHGEPVGLGPRVPLIVISPWSKGGYVNSQLHDHTSVIRFLEVRFGVMEPHISPWRRAVTGDLTSHVRLCDPQRHARAPARRLGPAGEGGQGHGASLPRRPRRRRAAPPPGARPAPGEALAVRISSRRLHPGWRPFASSRQHRAPRACGLSPCPRPAAASRASTQSAPTRRDTSPTSCRLTDGRLRSRRCTDPMAILREYPRRDGRCGPARSKRILPTERGEIHRITLHNDGSSRRSPWRSDRQPTSMRRHGCIGWPRGALVMDDWDLRGQPQLVRLRRHLRRSP